MRLTNEISTEKENFNYITEHLQSKKEKLKSVEISINRIYKKCTLVYTLKNFFIFSTGFLIDTIFRVKFYEIYDFILNFIYVNLFNYFQM